MTAEARRPPRIGIVDAVRGLACVSMIVWHTADAWLTDAIHQTMPFERARLIGGFAAPFFLWLAGLSIALSTELRPSSERMAAGLVRAGWVIAVGYALKLVSWIVDLGAILVDRNRWTMAIAVPAMTSLLLAFREPTRLSTRTRVLAGVLGSAGLLYAYSHLEGTSRSPYVLARLDVLHGIGAALFVMTLLLFALGRIVRTERARAIVLAILAVAVALATPHWIGVSLDPLPTRIVDYVARTVADPSASGARFALFPWLGHALFGAAIGTLLRSAPRDLGPHAVPFVSRPWTLSFVAALIMLAVFEAGPLAPSITARAEWMRPLLRLAFYGTTAMGCAGLLAYVGRAARPIYDGLSTMGRSSLLVYGAHLELAYGLLGIPIQRSLGWAGWGAAAALLTVLMVVLAHLAESFEKKGSSPGRTPAARAPG